MSNLVTPMLTSVESPVEFYSNSLRFTNSPCAIINSVNDQICISDAPEWNDLEHLVDGSLFKTSTPNKSHNVSYNRKIFGNACSVSNDNTRIQESKHLINDYAQCNEINLKTNISIEYSKVINNIWNVSSSENNSCSKACVNVNMGYNEGSSLESMVSNKNAKSKADFNVPKNVVEISSPKQIEAPITKLVDTIAAKSFMIPAISSQNSNYQAKTFKNDKKSGHSRQWGSCGSTAAFHINFDDSYSKSKLLKELKPLSTLNSLTSTLVSSPLATTTSTTTTTEMRDKTFGQTNRLKRISQLSFEAEFDSDGRTHEQITIDFTKFDHNAMSGQITQIELLYFQAIKSEEFLSFKWTSLSKHTHAPGIVASTRWFNQLNFWAQRIILECTELNRRSEMLIYVIRIIKKLVDSYNNLSSAMALMSALEVECIHRLKQTWNTLPNKDRATYRRMEELFSSANNFEKLREHINSLKLPCIPYLGLYLTDLTYINIAHSKLSEFESQTKTDQINNILRTVSEFQQSEYDISPIPNLYRYLESQRYIEELQKIIEENNYRTSMSLEPNLDSTSYQNTRQQQDFPPYGSVSPQKTPPSYACKHLSGISSLQSPISPKQMSAKPHNESINELPEQSLLSPSSNVDDQNLDSSVDDDRNPNNAQSFVTGDSAAVACYQECKDVPAYEDSLVLSSRQSDNDDEENEVRVSLLCGTGKKSQFKKRNSTSSNLRFKRNSQSSSNRRHRGSSKTTTLSSASQSITSDKEAMGQHSKSLLDDSYLDAVGGSETGAMGGSSGCDLSGGAQTAGLGDITTTTTSKHSDVLCAPPICKCIFKGDTIDLKPKATSKGKTEFSNLVNIAHAAEAAARFSEKLNFYFPHDTDHGAAQLNVDEMITSDDKDPLRLLCQGVLSRMVCLKNSKKSRFSMWNRQWMVLMMSRSNAFLVFFENSQFRALERKDFKSKKCHVQDLKRVVVSRVRPSLDKCISEQTVDEHSSIEAASDGDNHGTVNHISRDVSDIRKFFLIDKEYGTVYKFRDPSTGSGGGGGGNVRKSLSVRRDRRSGGGDDNNGEDDCVAGGGSVSRVSAGDGRMPSVGAWYHLLKRSLCAMAGPSEENKDLIMLGDT